MNLVMRGCEAIPSLLVEISCLPSPLKFCFSSFLENPLNPRTFFWTMQARNGHAAHLFAFVLFLRLTQGPSRFNLAKLKFSSLVHFS